jgi:hypothetical protein
MPEGLSGEVAHKLSEHEAAEHDPARWHGLLEIIEVILLAVVAIATAWSGLQASRWDGQQSLRYGQASRDRFEADAASTLAGQQLSADAAMFTAWLQAHLANDPKLQALLVRRFTPDYRIAFDAWLTTDPFGNPSAPSGPAAMPQYSNPNQQKANQFNSQASATFDQGNLARDNADHYVRDTVLFAAVLFLVAIAQRFTILPARIALAVLAGGLVVYLAISLVRLPRLS